MKILINAFLTDALFPYRKQMTQLHGCAFAAEQQVKGFVSEWMRLVFFSDLKDYSFSEQVSQ